MNKTTNILLKPKKKKNKTTTYTLFLNQNSFSTAASQKKKPRKQKGNIFCIFILHFPFVNAPFDLFFIFVFGFDRSGCNYFKRT